jgi:hypothetical protein
MKEALKDSEVIGKIKAASLEYIEHMHLRKL